MIAEPRRFAARAVVLLALCLACSSESNDTAPGSGGTNGAAGAASAGSAGTSGAASASGSSSGGSAGMPGGGSAGSAAGGAGSGGAAPGGSGGVAGSSAGSGGSGGGMMLEPCAEPAVSRLKVWEMQVMGGTQSPPGDHATLRQYDGGGYEMYVEWTLDGGGYGTANAPLKNKGQYTNGIEPAEYSVDISTGPGITIEYSSTGNTYMQIRTGTEPHGGDHFRADLPATDGQIKTVTLALADFRRPNGTTPPGDDVLKDAFSFTFVGGGTTKLAIRQVLIPGFVPPCD